MSGLTEAERRGARLLAVLLVLGTLTDAYRARHPERAPAPPEAPLPAASAAPGGADPQRPTSALAGPHGTLDVNLATVAELDRLPGIGPVLARRIVEHRDRHGRFRAVDELLSVPGIGPRLVDRLRPHLREPGP